MLNIIFLKVAFVFFAAACGAGLMLCMFVPVVALLGHPVAAVHLLAAAQLLAIAGGAGWSICDSDLHRAQWEYSQRLTR